MPIRVKLVHGQFGQSKMHFTFHFCPDQPGSIECTKTKEYLRAYCPDIYCGQSIAGVQWDLLPITLLNIILNLNFNKTPLRRIFAVAAKSCKKIKNIYYV